jgi:hypothetical protein
MLTEVHARDQTRRNNPARGGCAATRARPGNAGHERTPAADWTAPPFDRIINASKPARWVLRMREPPDSATPAEIAVADDDPAPPPAATRDYDLARRKLLKLAAYVVPAITATFAVRNAGAQTFSCAPRVCAPNVCQPNRCAPTCQPNGGCAPGSCGPVGCVPGRCKPDK